MMRQISVILMCLNIFSFQKEESASIRRNDKAYYLDIPLSESLQNPAFSPDGKSIVFTRFIQAYIKEAAEIYKHNLNTKKASVVSV